jgi:hypothetical protein
MAALIVVVSLTVLLTLDDGVAFIPAEKSP